MFVIVMVFFSILPGIHIGYGMGYLNQCTTLINIKFGWESAHEQSVN